MRTLRFCNLVLASLTLSLAGTGCSLILGLKPAHEDMEGSGAPGAAAPVPARTR